MQWAVVALLGYDSYLVSTSTGSSFAAVLLCGLIMLNGWISSRAATYFYSDALLVTDVAILFAYHQMLISLHRAPHAIPAVFWIYSGLLASLYAVWDLLIRPHTTGPSRKRRLVLYIVLLCLVAVLQFAVAFFASEQRFEQTYLAAVGICSWGGILALWHWDKRRWIREVSGPESA